MLIIEDERIYLTRGDDAVLTVENITDANGDAYTMQEGDVLTLTVRAIPKADDPVLMRIVSATSRLVIVHADTVAIEPGKYSADIQLTTAAGRRYTIWPLLEDAQRMKVKNWGNMIIMPEVTTE